MDSKGAAVAALKKAAILDINKGNLDKAVVKLQKLLQVCKSRKEDEAGKSIIPLWSMLGEAYKKQNSLQSAVRVFKHVLEIDDQSLMAHIQLMSVYEFMGKFEEALEEAKIVKKLSLPSHMVDLFDLQYAYIVSLLAGQEEEYEKKVVWIREILPILHSLFDKEVNSVCLHKTLANVYYMVQGFHGSAFNKALQVLNLPTYGILNKLDLINKRCEHLKYVLERNNKFADSWYAMALCLIDLFEYTNETQHAKSACYCLKKALTSNCSIQKKSQYYLSLGVVYSKLSELQRASHCLIRSIQLNKLNDKSWCALSFVYLRAKEYDAAFQAMQLAQQINPNYMLTWFAHALHAEVSNHYETMDLYRHTIYLQPHKLAVQKYAYHLSKALEGKKKIDQHTMIDFKRVLNLCDFSMMNPKPVLAVSFLAERFWYLEDAFRLVSTIRDYVAAQKHISRITVKAMMGGTDENLDKTLLNLALLYRRDVNGLYETLQLIPAIGKLIDSLKNGDAIEFSTVFSADMYPLVCCILLLYNFVAVDNLKQVLKSKRPLHSLADFYPEGLRSVEERQFQQEEGIIVTEDNLTTRLYELLKQKAEIQINEES